MAFFSTDDEYRLYFDEYGNRNNPTVIFTYDIGGKRSFFSKQAEGLSDTYHVVTWDYRGNGSAEKRHTKLNPERIAADLEELITLLGKDRVILAGSGFGTSLIFNYIRLFTDRKIDKVILMDASLKEIRDEEWEAGRLADKKEAIDLMKDMTYDWKNFAPKLLKNMFGTIEVSENDEKLITEKFLNNDNRMMMPLMVEYITEDNRETASSITKPILLTYGADREEADLKIQKLIQSVFKAPQIKAFRGGTLHNYLDAEAFNVAVKEFLA